MVFVTVRELAGVLGRRWYVLLSVLLIVAAGGVLLARAGGVYTTSTIISFMLPEKTSLSPNSGIDDISVIAFAGSIAQQLNNGKAPAAYSTDDAPYYGAGVREGVLVSLPNAGNQWASSYLRAEIEIQVVGTTETWVAATRDDLMDRAYKATDALQIDVEDAGSLITASVVPLTTRVFAVMPTRGTQLAAAGALLVAALLVGAWLSVLVDRSAQRRRARGRGVAE